MSEVSRFLKRMRDAADEALLRRHPGAEGPEDEQPSSSPALTQPPPGPTAHQAPARAAGARVPGEWLTVADAVRYLGLPSRKALYQAVRRGHFPVHRIGRCLRFSKSELDGALRER